MDVDTLTAVLLVLCGGLFGWLLGNLPDRWVYAITAVAVLLIIIVLGNVR